MKITALTIFIILFFCVLFVSIGLVWDVEAFQSLLLETNFLEILTISLGIITVLVERVFAYRNAKRETEETKEVYENIRGSVFAHMPTNKVLDAERIKELNKIEHKQEVATDILELMLANMKEIKDYYVLSKMQAKNSFGLAVTMCIMGFILMGISVAAAFFNSGNLISTIVPAIGAAIVEIIAGTSLFVYRKSLDQLNRYYNSLHSNERFLSMVNIVSKVSGDKQDDVYIEIIRSQIDLISKGEMTAGKTQ